jgi:membrane associated rhomboid family serine protease
MTASVPEMPPPTATGDFPEGSVDAGIYATHRESFQHSLVVLAMGEPCWLIESAAGHHLRVESPALETVRQQLALFDRESIGWPPRPLLDPAPPRRNVPLSPLLWVLAIFAVFWAQGEWPGLTDATLLDARRVFAHGEWWRAASALWLHDDLAHLVSNAGGGLLVFSAVVATFGLGAGWLLLTGAAIAGNLAAAALHFGDDYRSLGASTAIFAGLGLLTGRAIRALARSDQSPRWRTMFPPLASGVVVLGLFGAGGVNIDALAHATGFGAGLATGLAAGNQGRASAGKAR